MPKVSARGTSLPQSPIRKLVPFADAAKAAGKKIYHLNIGQPDIATPASALEAVRSFDLPVLAYSHSAGNIAYREKLATYYASFGAEISSDQIIVTSGASEALFFGLMSILDPGDEIIVPEPFYANYNGFSLAGNIQIKPITARIENGFALPPIEVFEKHIGPKTKAILICNPSNPTGYLYSKEELEVLRTIVQKHDMFLLADEVYREFCYDGHTFTSILTLQGMEKHAIVFDSISKRYSACGARIGMLISRNEEVMATAMKFAQARLSPPTLAQVLGEATLEVQADYLKEAIAKYDERRKLLTEKLKEIPGVECPVPTGAFYAFIGLPIDNADRFCQWLLESFDLNGETIMVAPGTGFYATEGLGKNQVRMAYVLNKTDLEKACTILKAALEAYPGRTN
ncbi:MAG: pyridoxal phosphate-dependent aminotransferase [Bacteroidota bacterium]